MSFLKDFNLVYIIGIVSALVGGIWAFYRFVYEKKLERFKDSSSNLFNDDENTVLAAVANLGVFKKDIFFKRNTVAVLLTRLYRELNYNISNAIVSALIDFSRRDELLYIASEISGINRNFFIQNQPYRDKLSDLNSQFERLNRILNNDPNDLKGMKPVENQTDAIGKWKDRLTAEFIQLDNIVNKELLWHKQIMADTYSRIIRRAYNVNLSTRTAFWNYLEQVFFDWDFRFYGKKIPIEIYQNAFAYIHLVQFNTSSCRMRRSGFEDSLMADIEFNNIIEISNCFFTRASIRDCIFRNGNIKNSLMAQSYFTDVQFIQINFQDIYFIDSSFTRCTFTECKGLGPMNFYNAGIDSKTRSSLNLTEQATSAITLSEIIASLIFSDLRPGDIDELVGRCTKKMKTKAEFLGLMDIQLDPFNYAKVMVQAGKDFPSVPAANEVTLKDVYDKILNLRSDQTTKSDMLYYMYRYKPLPELMEEIYYCKMVTGDIKPFLLNLNANLGLPDYTAAIGQSRLLQPLQEDLVKQMEIAFAQP